MDGGAWWAAVHGVAKSRTWLSNFTFTFHFHALEKEMATHASVLAWRIPRMGEPGGLPSMGSHRFGHDWRDLAALAAAVMLRYHSRHRLVPLLWSSWFHVFQPLSCCSLFNDHHGISSQKNHPHFYSHSLLTQPRECLVPAPGAIQKVWGLSLLASGPSQP